MLRWNLIYAIHLHWWCHRSMAKCFDREWLLFVRVSRWILVWLWLAWLTSVFAPIICQRLMMVQEGARRRRERTKWLPCICFCWLNGGKNFAINKRIRRPGKDTRQREAGHKFLYYKFVMFLFIFEMVFFRNCRCFFSLLSPCRSHDQIFVQ